MIFFKKYKERKMYLINPYTSKSLLPLNALVAPANFDPAAQNVNIHEKFSYYDNQNKAYAYTFSDSYNTLTLAAASGVSYRYGYTRGGVDYVFDVSDIVNPFSATDTKRWIIVNSNAVSPTQIWPTGAVWGYLGGRCTTSSSVNSNVYLKYIHYQSSVTYINSHYNCTGLTGNLIIPSTVTGIGQSAFSGCTGLIGSLTIPNSVTIIGGNAFYNCTGLTGSLTMSNSITSIGNFSFQGCTGFTGSLTIPSTVTSIGNMAFYGCSGFTGSLNIPNSVATIGYSAFQYCTGFTGTLSLPDNVNFTTINYGTFKNCTYITSVTIPGSVTIIDGGTGGSVNNGAFQGCVRLSSITIPNSVTKIGRQAFDGCTLATFNSGNLTLSNITYLADGAFRSTRLSHIDVSACNFNTISDNGYLGVFYGCSYLVTAKLPNAITSIPMRMFKNCTSLFGFIIPTSCTLIDGGTGGGDNYGAFQACTSLTEIDIPSSVTTINNKAFYGCTGIQVYKLRPATAPASNGVAFGSYAKPLHIPGSSSGYDIAPWTTTTIFSSIIADL